MASPADTLAQHAALTESICHLLRERGDLISASTSAYADTWRNSQHLAVTERRETCKNATAHFECEIAKVDGEIAALRAELQHAELVLQHADS